MLLNIIIYALCILIQASLLTCDFSRTNVVTTAITLTRLSNVIAFQLSTINTTIVVILTVILITRIIHK